MDSLTWLSGLGGLLRRLRQEGDIGRNELARRLGVTPTAVSKWEHGSTQSLEGLVRYLEAIGRVGVLWITDNPKLVTWAGLSYERVLLLKKLHLVVRVLPADRVQHLLRDVDFYIEQFGPDEWLNDGKLKPPEELVELLDIEAVLLPSIAAMEQADEEAG